MTYFYFVLTNPETEDLTKLEVGQVYPGLKLSYSRPGFLTFKSETPVSFKPLMCRLSGVSLGKFSRLELNLNKAWVWKRDPLYIIPSELEALSQKSLFRIGEKVTLIMMVGGDEFWVGEYVLGKTHFQTPGEVSSIEPTESPSRAYYKIAEAYEAFDLPFDHQELVLELGSAPGGASQFLLEQDLKVIGVDPAEMDPRITKNYNFRHIKRPFETLKEEDFPREVDWIVSDVNLPPTVVIKEVERLLKFLSPRGLVLTLKINQDKHLGYLPYAVEAMKKRNFNRVELKHLPSHRREVVLVAMNS